MASKNNPRNTRTVAIHCLAKRLLPKNKTDPKTVKNFLVVVTIEHGSGPNSATVKNIKYCPQAPATAKFNISTIMPGWRCKNWMKLISSPESTINTPLNTMDQKFMLSIMWRDCVLCSALILSCTALVKPSIVNDSSNKISPNPIWLDDCVADALPSLYMNIATPVTISKTKKYFRSG